MICVTPLTPTGVSIPGSVEYQTMPDNALIEGVAAGSELAMMALYDRHSRLLYAVALRVTRSPHHAEDVLQDILMQIWRTPQSFTKVKGSLARWLAIVARNRAVDYLRGRRFTETVEDDIVASPGDIAVEIERRLLCARAHHLMNRLPSEQREALELAFFCGLTHAEISHTTKLPLGTVKTRIRGGLIRLRKGLHSSLKEETFSRSPHLLATPSGGGATFAVDFHSPYLA